MSFRRGEKEEEVQKYLLILWIFALMCMTEIRGFGA